MLKMRCQGSVDAVPNIMFSKALFIHTVLFLSIVDIHHTEHTNRYKGTTNRKLP